MLHPCGTEIEFLVGADNISKREHIANIQRTVAEMLRRTARGKEVVVVQKCPGDQLLSVH